MTERYVRATNVLPQPPRNTEPLKANVSPQRNARPLEEVQFWAELQTEATTREVLSLGQAALKPLLLSEKQRATWEFTVFSRREINEARDEASENHHPSEMFTVEWMDDQGRVISSIDRPARSFEEALEETLDLLRRQQQSSTLEVILLRMSRGEHLLDQALLAEKPVYSVVGASFVSTHGAKQRLTNWNLVGYF